MKRITLVIVSLVSAAAGFGMSRTVTAPIRGAIAGAQGQQHAAKTDRSNDMPSPKSPPPRLATAAGAPSKPDARTSILESFLPDLSEDELETLIVWGISYDEDTQLKLLGLFLSSENPFVHELFRRGVSSWHVSVVEACLDAFDREPSHDRKLLLAGVFGSVPIHPRVLTRGQEILAGTDSRMQIHLLRNWNLRLVPEDGRDSVLIRLRELVVHGEAPELKMAAIRALDGDKSDAGMRFFLDRVLYDGSEEVRIEAFNCFPWNYGSNMEVRNEALRGLYTALSDPSAGPSLKRKIAQGLNSYVRDRKQTLFTPEELEKIKGIADRDPP